VNDFLLKLIGTGTALLMPFASSSFAETGASRSVDQPCTLAITNVSAIPMDSERILTDQTIRIAGTQIASIAPSTERGDNCAQTVSGRGLFALPGLNDMHVHVETAAFAQSLQFPEQSINYEDVLFPYLAYGVTGIRIMTGASDILAFRDSEHGVTPAMLVGTPMLSGAPPVIPEPITHVLESPEAAIEAVNTYADAGYDFIKIRRNLTSEVLEAVIAAARARNLDVDGHLQRTADPSSIVQNGIAHIDELSLLVRRQNLDPEELADGLIACRCYVTTTLTVEQSAAAQLRDYDSFASRPEIRFVHPMLRRAWWVRERNPYLAEAADPAFFDDLLQTDLHLVRVLNRRGVPLIAGTDALIPMIVPGASLHDELALLEQAGLSPFEVLSTATRTPAQIFPAFGNMGTLEAGKTANIILIADNPLRNIGALEHPEAVIVDGIILARSALETRMESIAMSYEAQ